MQLIILYFTFLLVSFGIETFNELSMFKEIANRGYKLDLNKVSNYIDSLESFKWFIYLFIPGLNVINSFVRMNKYMSYKKNLDKIINETDLFIKMSDEEYDSYLNNPKSIKAFNMNFDCDLVENLDNNIKPRGFIRISNGIYRADYNDGTFNEIKFDKNDEYIIVRDIKGELSKLDGDVLISELNKIFYCLYKKEVIIEKKSNIILEKETLINEKEEIINSLENDGVKLRLK